jgi:sugar phosphate isomerase/epimerase
MLRAGFLIGKLGKDPVFFDFFGKRSKIENREEDMMRDGGKKMFDLLKLKRGLSLKFFGKISDKILEECRLSGIECVELSFPLKYFEETNFVDEGIRYKESAARAGVELWSIHLPYGEKVDISSRVKENRNYGIEYYSKLIGTASLMGVKVAVMHPSYEPISEEERKERIAISRESIEILAETAKDAGMKLAVEDLPRTGLGNKPSELVELIKGVPNAGVCFDTNHSMIVDNPTYLKTLQKNRLPIYTLHLSDYDFAEERHRLPGDGINDWNKIFDLLEEAGYRGPLMYEVNEQSFGRVRITLKDIAENQRKLVSRLL